VKLPLGELKYLYVGSRRFPEDARYYKEVLGGQELWSFEKFGARVAAFRLAEGPLVLIADHRPAPSCMPVFAVERLGETLAELQSRGWEPTAGPIEIPDGPCFTFVDPSGNELAVFGNVRPDALQRAAAGSGDAPVATPTR
jgi:predicted enzyme related to lactoylglutathione lyase